MKIVVLDGYTLNPGDLSWEGLKNLGDVTIYDRTKEEDIIDRIGDAEIIFTNKTPLTKETLSKTPTVKYIGVLATGYNVVDVDGAKELDIKVTNIPTYGTTAVAQFVFALLLEICHHVWDHNIEVKKGTWTNSKDFCFWNYPLIELAGKTMGLVGYGRIGKAVANIAKGFGLEVIAYDKFQKDSDDITTMVSLDELYEKSDVISLHCPLFEDTKGMINSQAIAKMKKGVIIINTSRGPLIVEEDLKTALEAGDVYSAGMDVVSTEPILEDNVLLEAKNTIITPHIAWAPKESRKRLMDIAVSNLEAFIAGNPVNVVNK